MRNPAILGGMSLTERLQAFTNLIICQDSDTCNDYAPSL